MVVLCDGMFRSGSTWSFNVAIQLIKSSDSRSRVFGLYNDYPAVLRAAVRPRQSHLVIKSHNLHPSAFPVCLNRAVKAIFTWRHPYDAVASAMQMFGKSFAELEGALRNALRVWSFHQKTQSACIIPYESILREPQSNIRTIAAFLGLEVSPTETLRIAESTSLKQMKFLSQNIDRLPPSRLIRHDGLVYDRKTLLHQNHIRDGRMGRWTELLDSADLLAIDAVLQEEGFRFLCRSSLSETDERAIEALPV